MKLPAKDSPAWPLIRMILRTACVAACLAFVYKSVDARDILTLAIFVISDGAISQTIKGGTT